MQHEIKKINIYIYINVLNDKIANTINIYVYHVSIIYIFYIYMYILY